MPRSGGPIFRGIEMAEFPFCCAKILGGTCFENSRTAVENRQLDENRFLALRWNLWDDYTDALQRATPGAHMLESCRIEHTLSGRAAWSAVASATVTSTS